MNYKIMNHNNVCVVSIMGNIGREDRDLLLKCVEEVKSEHFKSAFLLFQNVDSIEMGVYRELTLLQHEIRQKRDRLRVVGLKSTLRSALGEKGVIRVGELISDLKEVLTR